MYLLRERKLIYSTCNLAVNGIRFLFREAQISCLTPFTTSLLFIPESTVCFQTASYGT